MRSRIPRRSTGASTGACLMLAMAVSCKSTNTSPPPQVTVARTVSGVLDAVDGAGYRADLEFMAASARPPGSPQWQATQDRCADVMHAAGMTVSRQVHDRVVNVIGRRPGTGSADEVVLIGAHYDSLPNCPGADDNASGVAGVLQVAHVLGGQSHRRTLVCACWDQEETGYLGSQAFVQNMHEQLGAAARLVAHFNLEMIGFSSRTPYSQTVPSGFGTIFPRQIAALEANQRRGDFIAVITDGASARAATKFVDHAGALGLPYQRLDVPENLKTSWLISDLRLSDHRSFWDRGLPGVMLTDTANFRNPNYHCTHGTDRIGTLDLDFAIKVVKATARATAELLDQ